MREIISNEHNGLVVTPGDNASLAVALNLLLADDALADRLGANAQSTIRPSTAPLKTMRAFFASTALRSMDGRVHPLHRQGFFASNRRDCLRGTMITCDC